MKRYIAGVWLATLVFAGLCAGCKEGGTSLFGQKEEDKGYDVYVLSSIGQMDGKFAEMCRQYEKISGVRIKSYAVDDSEEYLSALRDEMESNKKPSVFSVRGMRELNEWKNLGFVMDLNNATVKEFRQLAENVPGRFRLTSNGSDNLGIPLGVNGYGYMVDKQMVSDLLGEDKVDSFLADMKKASYEEFTAFVEDANAYIKGNKIKSFKLSGNEYSMRKSKTGLATKLTGVFAVAGADPSTYADKMLNLALSAVFESPQAASVATSEQIDSARGAITGYVQALDFKTSYVASNTRGLTRSGDFVNVGLNDYGNAMQRFALGKSIFINQGNLAVDKLRELNPDMPDRIALLPVKMPLRQEDIKVSGMTVEHFNSCVPVYASSYFAVNPKVSAREQELAQKFLSWLYVSEEGRSWRMNEFKFIPYDVNEFTSLTEVVDNEIMSYLKDGNILPGVYLGVPSEWSTGEVAQKLMTSYLIEPKWGKKDYERIVNYTIDKWKEIRAA